MFATRFKHAAVTLVAVLAAYQAYALLVVPIVEPRLPERRHDAASDEEWQGGGLAVARYQAVLASYLPDGHWALSGTPQVYEYGQVMLVLEDYTPDDRGRVRIERCVVVGFPTPRTPGQAPPRDAVIVEAPGGATLQFEQPVGPDAVGLAGGGLASGGLGRPVAGELHGELLVRSDMHEPGPHDDLRIVTRDLRLNQAMVATPAEVRLSLGPHRATGRLLEVRLLADSAAAAPGASAKLAGVASLEVRQDVRATIHVPTPGGGKTPATAPQPTRGAPGRVASRSVYSAAGRTTPVRLTSAAPASTATTPVDVACDGPFRFDFTEFVATLTDNVRAVMPRPEGPADRLTCGELRVALGGEDGRSAAFDPADEPNLARRQGRTLGGLTPRMVEALGAPVRLDSPTRELAVRGRRVRIWPATRRLRLEGAKGGPASLAQGLSEVRAPAIDYTAPPEGSGRSIGELAVAGPGWLRVSPPGRGDRTYQAAWKAIPSGAPAATITRDPTGQPVLEIIGRPEFAASGLGKLRADRVLARLRETPADGEAGPAIEVGSGAAILPQRIDAIGSVDFVGEQIEGRSDSLVAMFRAKKRPAAVAAGGPTGWNGGGRTNQANESAATTPKP
ncbi:MAG: hypothetical protein AAF805_01740, partial [Planctomycetota bacterium]